LPSVRSASRRGLHASTLPRDRVAAGVLVVWRICDLLARRDDAGLQRVVLGVIDIPDSVPPGAEFSYMDVILVLTQELTECLKEIVVEILKRDVSGPAVISPAWYTELNDIAAKTMLVWRHEPQNDMHMARVFWNGAYHLCCNLRN